MSPYITFLITVLYDDSLLRCALKVDRNALPGDCAEYPLEPENRAHLHGLLPLHVRNCGPIVEVEQIFECEIVGKE